MRTIKTVYVHPPIPIRSHDWAAFRDGEEEGPIGYGATEWEAVKDLTESEEVLDKVEDGPHGTEPSQAPEKKGPPPTVYSSNPHTALVELIDGAYDVVEISIPQSPAQLAWKESWLRKARELGVNPTW